MCFGEGAVDDLQRAWIWRDAWMFGFGYPPFEGWGAALESLADLAPRCTSKQASDAIGSTRRSVRTFVGKAHPITNPLTLSPLNLGNLPHSSLQPHVPPSALLHVSSPALRT